MNSPEVPSMKEIKKFVVACRIGKVGFVNQFLKKHGGYVNENFDGETGLGAACYEGKEAIVRLLLHCPYLGVNIVSRVKTESFSSSGTPLYWAIKNDHYKIVNLLLLHKDIDSLKDERNNIFFGIKSSQSVDELLKIFDKNKEAFRNLYRQLLLFSDQDSKKLTKFEELKEKERNKIIALQKADEIYSLIEEFKTKITKEGEIIKEINFQAIERRYDEFFKFHYNKKYLEAVTKESMDYFDIFCPAFYRNKEEILAFNQIKSKIYQFKKTEIERKKLKQSKIKEEFEEFEALSIKNSTLIEEIKKKRLKIVFIEHLFGLEEKFLPFNQIRIDKELKHLTKLKNRFQEFQEAFEYVHTNLENFNEQKRKEIIKCIKVIEKRRKKILNDKEFVYFRSAYNKTIQEFENYISFDSVKQLLTNLRSYKKNSGVIEMLKTSRNRIPSKKIKNGNGKVLYVHSRWDRNQNEIVYSLDSEYYIKEKKKSESNLQQIVDHLKKYTVFEIPKESVSICSNKNGFDEIIRNGKNGIVKKGLLFGNIDVAIKFVSVEGKNKDDIDQMISEIKFLKLFDNDFIVRVYGYLHENENTIGLIMEYSQNESLQKFLLNTKISKEEKWNIIKELIIIIQFLHQKEIIHSDIKPENFLVTKNDQKRRIIKICDLTFAQYIENEKFSKERNKFPKRNEKYLPKNPQFSKETDIYGLGMVIYELVCKKTPLKETGNDDNENFDLDRIKNCKEFKEIVTLCTKENPKERITLKNLIKLMEKKENAFLKVCQMSKTTSESMDCVICLDNEKNTIFYPCKHICVCKECSEKVGKCPICRSKIKERHQVFHS